MKWLVFTVALAGVYPLGRWLKKHPRAQGGVWLLVGFLPFYGLDSLDINVVSFEHYRGDARGIEVTIVDLLALALAVALPKLGRAAPYVYSRGLYFVIVLMSVAYAAEPLFASFSVWKLARMYVLFAIVARGCRSSSWVAPTLLSGMCLGIAWELVLVLQQRYLFGVHQATGSLPHQNTLGMALNLLLPAVFAIVLAGGHRGRRALLVLCAGAVCIVMTLSRGAMAAFAVGVTAVLVCSFARQPTWHKARIAGGMAIAAAAVFVKAGDTIIDRFLNAPKMSGEGRDMFEVAAHLMVTEHPLGVGVNNFSWFCDVGGYSARVGLPAIDRGGIVHNVYWLTAAELGYVGLLAFALLLLRPTCAALYHGLTSRRDVRGDVLLGLGVGLLLMHAQGSLEWASRQTTLSYLFWIVAALVASIGERLRHERSTAPRRQS